MSTSGIQSAGSSVGLSVQVTRKAQVQMAKDGLAAVSLIRANEAVQSSGGGQSKAATASKVDVVA